MTYRWKDRDTVINEATGETFRFAGGNAPESSTAAGAQPIPTDIAKAVQASTPDRLQQDYYGRTVSRFLTPDGQDINQQMVDRGILGAGDYTGSGGLYTPKSSYAGVQSDLSPEERAAVGVDSSKAPPIAVAPKQQTTMGYVKEGVIRGADTAKAGYYGTVSALGNLISRDPDGAGPQKDTRSVPDYVKDPKTGANVRNPDLSLRDRFSNWLQRSGERGYARNMEEAAKHPKTASFQGVLEGKNDLLTLVAESFGEAIPSILEMVGAGAAVSATGGLAGAALGAAASRGALGAGAKAMAIRFAEQQLTNAVRKRIVAGAFDPAMKGMAQVEAQQMAKGVVANLPEYATRFAANKPVIDALRAKSVAGWAGGQAAGIGGRVGAFGSSAGMQAGQFYEEDKNAEGGVASPGRSLLAGAAAGALDLVGIEFLLHRFLKPGVDIKTAMDVVKHIGAQGALGMGGEGATEAVQEVIGVLNNEWDAKTDVPLLDRMTSKENLWRYAEAGVAGAIFGGIFGASGGAVSGMVNKQSTPTPSPEPSSPGAPTIEPVLESDPGAGPPPLDETAPPVESTSPTGPTEPAGAPEASPTESPVVQASPQSDPVVDTTGQPPPVAPPAPPLPPSEPTRRPRLPLETPTGESQGRQDRLIPPSEAPQVLETGKSVVIKPTGSVTPPVPVVEPPAAEAPAVSPTEGGKPADLGNPVPVAPSPVLVSASDQPAPALDTDTPAIETGMDQGGQSSSSPLSGASNSIAPSSDPTHTPVVEPPKAPPAKPKAKAKAKPSVTPAPKVETPPVPETKGSVVAESPLSIKAKDRNDPRLSGEVFTSEAEAKPFRDALWALGVQTEGKIEDTTQTHFALHSVASATTGAEWTAAQSGVLGYAQLHAVQKALDAVGGDPKALKTALDANPKVIGATYDKAYAAAVGAGLKPGEFVVGMRGKAFAYAPLKAETAKVEAPAAAAPVAKPPAPVKAPAAKANAPIRIPTNYRDTENPKDTAHGALPMRPEVRAALKQAQETNSFGATTSPTAFRAVIAGLRTATSRNETSHPGISQVQVGDILHIPNPASSSAPPLVVRVTHPVQKVGEVDAETWSKGEGWAPEAKTKVGKNWVWAQYEARPEDNPAYKKAFDQLRSKEVPTAKAEAAAKERLAQSAKPSKARAPTTGQTPEQFRQAVKHKVLDRANVNVLHRTQDAPFTVAPDTAGLYLPDGSSWFFTENIAPGEEWAKVFHEVGAHYGLARMVGRDAYAGILKDLKRMVAGDGFASVKEAHRRAVAAGATGAGVYHETLGYLAELSPRHGLVRRLITAVRQFLRSIGLVKAYTDADLIGLIQAAALKEGMEGRVGLDKGQMASKASPLTIEPTLDDRGGKRLVVGYGIFGNGQLLESFDNKDAATDALAKNRAEYEGYAKENAPWVSPHYKSILDDLDAYFGTRKREQKDPPDVVRSEDRPFSNPKQVKTKGVVATPPYSKGVEKLAPDVSSPVIEALRRAGQLHAASPEGDPAKPKLASHLAPTPLARLEAPALAAMAESLRAIKDPVDAAEHALSLMAAPEAEGIAKLLNQYRRIFAQNLSPERTLGAIEYLYATTLQQSDQLRALTAFVSQDDLPLHEHLLRALDAFDALRHSDSSTVADIERNMLPTAEADTAFGQKERNYLATVKAQQATSEGTGEMRVQSLYERDMLVHDTMYPTAALGKVISPLVTRTDNADSQAAKDEKSWRARKRLPALEQQLLALQDQAAANPSQTAEVALGDMEAWLNDGALTEAGEQLRTAMKKGKPDGQESKLLADLQLQRAWHDATAAPYGVLVLKYAAQRLGGDKYNKHSGRYLLVERITTFDPDLLQLVEDPKTKDLVTPKEWVRRLISEVTAYWDDRPEARGDAFWKDNVLEFHALDKLFDPYPGENSGGPVDMAGILEGKKTRTIALTAKQVVQIGKMMYKAIGSPLGQTPLMNYEMGLQTLLYDSGKHYVMTQASEQASDRKLLTGPFIEPGVVVADDKKGLWLGDARQAQARGQADLGVAADDELRAFKEWVERSGENSTAFKNWMKGRGLGNLRFQESPFAQGVYVALLKKWQAQQTNESPAFEEWLDNKENVAFLDRPDLQGKEGETTDGRGLATEEEQAGYSARMGRIGETSAKVLGNAHIPDTNPRGVFRRTGTEAHGVVSKIIKALNLTGIHVSLYNSDDVNDLLDAVEPYTQTYNRLRQGLLGGAPKKAAVAFIDGRILLYYDKNLTGKELSWALGHEMGHVVLRTVLENERRRSTVLWRRLLSQYQASESPESFMEWFADQAADWSLQDRRPKNLIEAFYRRVVDYFNKLLGAIGAKATPNAVHAYLDGLALKERAMEYQALAEALRGTTRYDLLTLQQTYHGADTMQRLVLDSPELDFLSPNGVVKKTAAAVKEWAKAHQTVNGIVTSAAKGRRTVVEWGHDVLDTTGGWLRGLNNPASTMLADMLDNGARVGVDGLLNTPGDVRAALEAINQDTRKRNLARDPGALPEPFVDVNALTGRAAQIFANRKQDGLLGVKVVTSLSRNGQRTTEVVPQLRESFAAAVNREDKGHWGASEDGYYKFWHKGTTEAEYQAIGEELLRNDPKSQRAKDIAVWLKNFFDAYVAPGFTGAYSKNREVHIGFREDWGMARYYSPEKIAANRQAFLDLLMTDDDSVGWVGMEEAQARNLTARIETGVELLPQEQPTTLLSPGASSRKRRNIPLAIDKLLPFLETDISKTLPKYVHSMVRRVEWDRRFSDEKWNGKKWVWHRNVFFDALRGAAEFNNDLPPQRQAQIREQINGIGEAAMGRYGALGADPRVRTGMSFIQTATNFLVLPLAALSQGTDFASPFIRTGGDLKNSLKGMREAFTAMRNTGGDVYKMAEMMGVIFRDTRNAFAASYLDAPYMTEGAQKWNDALFKWNGMQWLTTFNRIAAWQTSGHWLRDIATNGHPDAKRVLAQLDLTTKDLQEWRDQEFPDYTNGDAKDSVAYKVATARTRFVQESNFAPNASQRPLWANHPYAMLFWSLKSFTYSYFTQMLKPILREVKDNPQWARKAAAALPLLVLLPLAMAGLALRDELKYGLGRDARSPSDKDDWLETTGKVVSRTGIMGPLQLLMDADTASSYGRSFTFSLISPSLSKLEESFRAGSVTPLLPGLSMLPAERQALMRWMAED